MCVLVVKHQKLIAVLMSVVLAFSMVSTTALVAFADDLSAAGSLLSMQANDEVYDSVYGVIGGKYAIMTKFVTYEQVYHGTPMKATGKVEDVVKADGTVVLHTSNVSKEDASSAKLPGESTNLKMVAYNSRELLKDGRKIAEGYVKVFNKDTSKYGLKKLEDASDIVPCNYDDLLIGDDCFVCFRYGYNSIASDVLAFDGSSMGTFTFNDLDPSLNWSSYAIWRGDYILISASVYGENGSNYKGYEKLVYKNGSSYKAVEGFANHINQRKDAIIIEKTDGYSYYLPASGGQQFKLGPVLDGDTIAVDEPIVTYFHKDGSVDRYFTNGTKLDLGQRAYKGVVGDYVLATSSEDYAIYDNTNTVVHSGDAYNVNCAGNDYFVVCEEIKNVRLTPYSEGDDDDDYSYGSDYKLDLYKAPGTYVKTLFGSIREDCDDWEAGSQEAYVDGEYVIYAYYVNVGGEEHNYDTDWNEASSIIDYPDSSSSSDSSAALMFGTMPITARVDSKYENRTFTYTSNVKDADGNPVISGEYTLAIAVDGSLLPRLNSVKHGNADIWWATNGTGKWGAIDSSGGVVVPFEYESYYDAGQANTDYALVKKDGEWSFINLKTMVTTTPSRLPAYVDDGTSGNPVDGSGSNAGASVNPGTGASASASRSGSSTAAKGKHKNPMAVKGGVYKLKYSTVKRSKATLKASWVLAVKNAKGKVTYSKVSGNKKITVASGSGKVTVKKGIGKGAYKVKVKVSAAGNALYKSASVTKTFTIKVK